MIDGHGFHSGRYYNRSNPKYKRVECGSCRKIKPLNCMYGKDSITDVWICNICIRNREKVEKKSYFFDCVLKTINKCINRRMRVITVKRIRKLNDIESSDKSKINFIWSSLKFLEKNGFIERYNNTSPKQYRLPMTEIKIEKVIEK